MIAAKKHHTDVRYCAKNTPVIRQDIAIIVPNNHIRFTEDMKMGTIVVTR